MVQDKDDDVKVGMKSTALYFGDQTKSWLGIFGTVTISSLILAGGMDNLGMYG
jgi:4-hydroxybenzoate polyprenyltransferase